MIVFRVGDAPGDKYAADSQVLCDRNFNLSGTGGDGRSHQQISSAVGVDFLRHYERLLAELEGFPDAPGNKYAANSHVLCDRNFKQDWNQLPHATVTGHAQQRRDAYSDVGEVYPMLS